MKTQKPEKTKSRLKTLKTTRIKESQENQNLNMKLVAMKGSILIIDNEIETLSELAELLQTEGFTCFCALSVSQAMEFFDSQTNISLVITDLRMPDESGLRLIQRLRSHPVHNQIPIIVMSGHAGMDDVVGILRLGVIDFLPKPIYHEYLFEKLKKIFTTPENKHSYL